MGFICGVLLMYMGEDDAPLVCWHTWCVCVCVCLCVEKLAEGISDADIAARELSDGRTFHVWCLTPIVEQLCTEVIDTRLPRPNLPLLNKYFFQLQRLLEMNLPGSRYRLSSLPRGSPLVSPVCAQSRCSSYSCKSC